MPPSRPKLINALTRIPQIGGHLRNLHDSWLRHRINAYWQKENNEARQVLESNRPVLNNAQRRVLAELTECGIAMVHFDDLFSSWKLWNALLLQVNQWLDSEKSKKQEQLYVEEIYREARWKEYIIMMSAEKRDAFSIDNPLLILGLQPEIINIVNNYFGMMAKLFHVDVWKTIPLSHDRRLTGSQRWHRDPEDIKLVKVFLYLSDVDETAGPLHYIKFSRGGDKHGKLWPQRLPYVSVAPANEVEIQIPREDCTICTAPAGTFVLVDTTGLHMGGRASKRNRVFATWGFSSHGSVWSRNFKLDPSIIPEEQNLVTKYALSE